ncbi:MAG: cupin domain-containing protein [Kiloniellales bacterium]|nr:cupin domain-containing protein [Kiloniellales bacterium]
MSLVPAERETARSVEDIWARLERFAAEGAKPQLFKLRAQLLEQGRSDTPLAATDDLAVVLKVYASGGENALHCHPNEDHVFIILAGAARFYGPSEEAVVLTQNQGIMLPRGTFYRFYVVSEEPLVMVRVGAPANHKQPRPTRLDRDGNPMGGDAKENKTVPAIPKAGAYFG